MSDLSPIRQAMEDEVNRTIAPCPFCGKKPKYLLRRWVGERSIIQCEACSVVMGESPENAAADLPTRWNAALRLHNEMQRSSS